jgi:2-C-methyl-D-erythritol 2,4-cyclodiphosphate synthase
MADPGLRVGIGYDIHRLQPGAGLLLGGVSIPCNLATIAHSDGDVLLHACCDAWLGALGLGDLGSWFPDSDPAHAGRASREFWQTIRADQRSASWRVINCDSNIIAQQPRLAAHREAIRQHLTRLLDCPAISVKCRTKEGCDATGRVEAIEAQVVLLLGRE